MDPDDPAAAARRPDRPPAPLDPNSTQEEFLLALADGADRDAWEAFSARYGTLIRNFAGWCGLPPTDCDDVVQEVYLSLLKALPGFRYDRRKGRFRGYLKTATRRAAVALRRRRAAEPLPLERVPPPVAGRAGDSGPDLDEAWEREWRDYHVRRAMARLQPEFNSTDLAAFERYAIQGRPPAEVAAEFDLHLDQVYQAKSRILRRLRELVREQIEDEG
ncbi:MAG: sigma-70 family RNA polymerase sigma factor [Planctomycetota bacterium]|nr:MAG: sigma-70 family RNA polymerase sigma factor [Planctomycetota bacterium]